MRRNGFVLSNKNIITYFGAVRGLKERHKTELSPIVCAKAEKETGLRVLHPRVALSQSTSVCRAECSRKQPSAFIAPRRNRLNSTQIYRVRLECLEP
jgi:hypothetical protein